MTIATVNCPHCDCSYRMERGDEIRTRDCAACGDELCDECAQFECDGCGEIFCAPHKVLFDGDTFCPHCALYWAESAVKLMQRITVERMEQRMARATAAMKAWRATAAAQAVPFGESEVA
jgi:phage terminase large subunit GpA-like protein